MFTSDVLYLCVTGMIDHIGSPMTPLSKIQTLHGALRFLDPVTKPHPQTRNLRPLQQIEWITS